MAVDTAPALMRRRNVAFKTETTTGTFIALDAASGVTPVFTEGNDEVIVPSIEQVDREGQGSISPALMTFGARSCTSSFLTEVSNSGSATPPIWASRLLVSSGMALSSGGIYKPVTGATVTQTLAYYVGGYSLYSIGTMFSWTMRIRRGQPARIQWNGLGVWDEPDDDVLSQPTYLTTIAPRQAVTFTVGGATYRVPEVEIEFGNELVLREDITAVDSASEATGYRAAMIVDRQTRVRMSPEAIPIATTDLWDAHRDGTTLALSIVIGSGSNSVVTIACPKLQLVNPPGIENRNKMVAQRLEFMPVRNTDAGEDDVSITLS